LPAPHWVVAAAVDPPPPCLPSLPECVAAVNRATAAATDGQARFSAAHDACKIHPWSLHFTTWYSTLFCIIYWLYSCFLMIIGNNSHVP
jgi:hypothetical protein